MSAVPARWRAVLWATELATAAVGESGCYHASVRVVPMWVEAATPMAVWAGRSAQYRHLPRRRRRPDEVGE